MPGVVLIGVRDVTAMVEAQAVLAALDAGLAEEERLAAVGELALNVAQELGELVTRLQCHLARVAERPETFPREVNEALVLDLVDAQRALVDKLKSMSRPPGRDRPGSPIRPVARRP
jgi:hypothetical protein